MYDRELARAILEKLDEVSETLDFPDLKAALPGFRHLEDPTWLKTIEMLWKDGQIDGYFLQGQGVEWGAEMRITERGRAEIRQAATHSEGQASAEGRASGGDEPESRQERSIAEVEQATYTFDQKQAERGKTRSAWLDARIQHSSYDSDLDIAAAGGLSYNTVRRYRSGVKSRRARYVRRGLARAFQCDIKEVPD
jgi:hypothetical protein